MKATVVISLLLCFLAFPVSAHDMKNFDALKWKARILILSAPHENDVSLLQIEYLKDSQAGLRERDIVVIFNKGDNVQVLKDVSAFEYQLPHNYVSDVDDFSLTLIGKDGGVKKIWQKDSIPVSTEEIFSIIDAMPMRLNEMRHENDK